MKTARKVMTTRALSTTHSLRAFDATDRHQGWRASNWSANQRWGEAPLAEPTSLAELQEIVLASKRVRCLGSAHSFTPLISAGGDACQLLSLRKMPRTAILDQESRTLTVDASTTYSEVCNFLATHPSSNLALATVASLPHFSVAGAVATGTHGSSGLGADGRLKLSGLADAVVALEIVGADGALRTIERGDEDFSCAVTSLGMLGVVTRLTLSLVDGYNVRQRVYGEWPPVAPTDTDTGTGTGTGAGGGLERLLASVPAALAQTDSLSAFVQWSVDAPGMMICRDKLPAEGAAPLAPAPTAWAPTESPLRYEPIEGFLEGFGAFDATSSGQWCDKMHIWMRDAEPFGPQGAPELQLEHFVPLKHAAEALERTRLVAREWGSSLLYAEIRAVRGDGQVRALMPHPHALTPHPNALTPHSYHAFLPNAWVFGAWVFDRAPPPPAGPRRPPPPRRPPQMLSPYTCDEDEGSDTLAITNGLDGGLGEARVLQASAVLEEALAPLRARPHWGKLFSYTPEALEDLYGERLARFRRVARRADPEGKFSNAWLEKMVMGGKGV